MNQIAKKILLVITPFVVSLVLSMVVFYLIGSFVSVNFDPTYWTMECRTVCAVFGFVWGLALLVKLEMMR